MTIGIWLMPNNQNPGTIETFAGLLVPANDTLWPRAMQCVDSIPLEERRFCKDHLDKAYIHT